MADNGKPKLLLHCCCAPCATYVIDYLKRDYNLTLYFCNPNIEPLEEYERRKNELNKLLKRASLEPDIYLLECDYDNSAFKEAVLNMSDQPEGGTRCGVCYGLRLGETAKRAKSEGFDIFTTTLSVSPHKNVQMINEIGNKAAAEHGVEFLAEDFKKKDGYLRSIEMTVKYNLQRQNYCGCNMSMR